MCAGAWNDADASDGDEQRYTTQAVQGEAARFVSTRSARKEFWYPHFQCVLAFKLRCVLSEALSDLGRCRR